MTWPGLAPIVVALSATVFVPGWLLLRLSAVRGLLALAGAPALSLAFYGLAAVGLDRAGISWGWPPLLVLLTLAAVVAAAVGWWVRKDARRRLASGRMARPAGLWAARYSQLTGRPALWIAGAAIGSAALMAIPIARGMVGPEALLQHWDAVFHANGVQAIHETGNASTLGAMQPLFGDVGANYYYPAVWHGIVALLQGAGSIAAAANASTFVFGIVVWLVGLAGLGHVLFVGRRHHVALTVLTVVFGASFSAFPFVILSTLAQWPFGVGIALIPGTTALVAASLRGVPRGVRFVTPARFIATLLILAGAIGAVALTHGSAFFSLLLILGPFGIAAAWRATARRLARGNRRRIVVTTAAIVVATVIVIVGLLNNATVAAMLRFERNTDRNYLLSALYTVADYPLTFIPLGTWPVTICVLAGVVVIVRRAWHRSPEPLVWVAGAWLAVVAFTALAAGPDVPLRMLTGFWYAQSARVAAVYPVVAAPLAAFGLVALASWLVTRMRQRNSGDGRGDDGADGVGRRASSWLAQASVARVTAGWVVLGLVATLGWHIGPKTHRFEQAYVPGEIEWGTMVSTDELDLLRRLHRTTSADALILGDPANGAAFAWSVGGRHVVLPHLGTSGMSDDQRLLRENFNELGTDSQICEVVQRLDVTHFYQDSAGTAEGAKVDEFSPGLQQPVTEQLVAGNLAIVDEAGTATLYKVTACQ